MHKPLNFQSGSSLYLLTARTSYQTRRAAHVIRERLLKDVGEQSSLVALRSSHTVYRTGIQTTVQKISIDSLNMDDEQVISQAAGQKLVDFKFLLVCDGQSS